MFDRESFKEVFGGDDEDVDAFLQIAAGRDNESNNDSTDSREEITV